jgi:hypothetical protein
MRIAAVVSGGLVLLIMSACATASRPDSGFSVQHAATSSGSLSGAPSYPMSLRTADLGTGDVIPAGYSEDRPQSTTLTSYLQSNRLPLVGAQVFRNGSGNRQVILHGFVATDFGKRDAAAKSRRYLNDPGLPVINRIVVRPELLASGDGGALSAPLTSASSASGSYSQGEFGTLESYQSQAQQAQSQQSQGEIRALILLIQLMSLFL